MIEIKDLNEDNKRNVKQEAKKKADRLLSTVDPLKLEDNLHIYLYNFAIKMLKAKHWCLKQHA